jgi:hypothetical protein
LKPSLRQFYGRHHDLVGRYGISVTNDHGYVPLVVNTSRSFPHSWLIIGFVTRLTRRVQLVEQELILDRNHLSSPPVFSGVHITRSLVLYVCFLDRWLSFSYFFFWPLYFLFFFDIWILITPLVFKLFLILQYWQSYHIFCIYKVVKFALNTIIVAIFKFL